MQTEYMKKETFSDKQNDGNNADRMHCENSNIEQCVL